MASKVKHVTITLTERQLADVVNCVGIGLDTGRGYGHCSGSEEALAVIERERLMAKLKRAYDAR